MCEAAMKTLVVDYNYNWVSQRQLHYGQSIPVLSQRLVNHNDEWVMVITVDTQMITYDNDYVRLPLGMVS